jgi:hypothetical protein
MTKEQQNIGDEWSHLMAEACLMAENISIPANFRDTGKKDEKEKMFDDEIPSENNVYNDRETAAEESFRRKGIYTTLDLIINDLGNCLEAHTNICDLFSHVLNYLFPATNLKRSKRNLLSHIIKFCRPIYWANY